MIGIDRTCVREAGHGGDRGGGGVSGRRAALNRMFRVLVAGLAANAGGPSAGFLVSLGKSLQTTQDGVKSTVTMAVPCAEFAKLAASAYGH